ESSFGVFMAIPLLATLAVPRRWLTSVKPAAAAPFGTAYQPGYPPPPGPLYPGAPSTPAFESPVSGSPASTPVPAASSAMPSASASASDEESSATRPLYAPPPPSSSAPSAGGVTYGAPSSGAAAFGAPSGGGFAAPGYPPPPSPSSYTPPA